MTKRTRIVTANAAFLAVCLGLLMSGCSSAVEDDTKAEEALKALGGTAFLRDRGGEGNITSLSFGAAKDTDAALKAARQELEGLKKLSRLDLTQSKVTDAGLKEIAGLKNLHFLLLAGTKVTDAGLKELAGLKNLQELDLDEVAEITDAGLKELAVLENLQSLNLRFTNVTDAGLKELAGLKNLLRVYCSGSHVTDAGEKQLRSALPKCEISHGMTKKK